VLAPFKLHLLSITAEQLTRAIQSDISDNEVSEILNALTNLETVDKEFYTELMKYVNEALTFRANKERKATNEANAVIAKMMKS